MPSGSASASQRVSAVPARANGLFYVDYKQFRTDQDLKRLLDRGVQSGTGADSVEGALESQGVEGIDPAKVYDVMGFTEVPEDDPMSGASSYGGAIVWTGLPASTVVSALKSAAGMQLTEKTYSGQTILVGEKGTGTVGVVRDGVYAVGPEQAVKDAIDVATGSGEAAGGKVVEALTDTEPSPVRFAVDVPTGTFTSGDGSAATGAVRYTSKIDVVSGSLFYGTGDKIGFRINATMTTRSAASQSARLLEQFKTIYLRRAKRMERGGEQLERMLENLSISQDGKTVSVSYVDTVDHLIQIAEGNVPMGGGGTGG